MKILSAGIKIDLGPLLGISYHSCALSRITLIKGCNFSFMRYSSKHRGFCMIVMGCIQYLLLY